VVVVNTVGLLLLDGFRRHLFLVPSDGVFGRFDPAAMRGCHTLSVCLFVHVPEAASVPPPSSCSSLITRNRPVAVVGGGDAAMEEAAFLARYASEVYVIHR
jgi:hypothetical protein